MTSINDNQSPTFDVQFTDFSTWAVSQSWLCIHHEKHEFGEERETGIYSAQLGRADGDMYVYLTPAGSKLTVYVKGARVLMINQSTLVNDALGAFLR